jgi:DNA-binding FadR family transcriptional regulator
LLEGAALETVPPDAPRLADAHRELELMRRPGIDVSAFHDADVRFHITLAGAGGNSAVPLVMNVLRHAIAAHLLETLEAMPDSAPTLARLAAEHAAILDAVEAGDGARARRMLRSHVEDFYAEHSHG